MTTGMNPRRAVRPSHFLDDSISNRVIALKLYAQTSGKK